MLILASSSPNRAKLLAKLNIEFSTISPDIDESRKDGENPYDMVKRLSIAKAKKVKENNNDDIIIASDQVGVLANDILTKPKTTENAIKQLSAMNGKTIRFYTGICVYGKKLQIDVASFDVVMRNLTATQIKNYVTIDNPLDCAGSFKSEGFGITLFKKMIGDDYNSLIGLPLIKLINMLKNENIDLI